jgi:hypothetical protein
MLEEVERLFGPRDESWVILGVEIGPDNPRLWYPGNRKHVLVQLGIGALNESQRACYQMAHECIHLLAPSGGSHAPVMEEGLATVYSEDYMKREFGSSWFSDLPSYTRAASLVRELLSIDPNSILRLRAEVPSFTDMNAETFVRAGVNAPQPLIAELIQPFVRQ